ncbi:MAG: hypothetical protein HPY59_00605 [Anaerolineae bacterium]|nr:hypothetical protein [Anaerolineae bacterium]
MTAEELQPSQTGDPAPVDPTESAHIELSIDLQPGMRVQVTIASGRAGEKPQISTQFDTLPLPVLTGERPRSFWDRLPPFLNRIYQRARLWAQKPLGKWLEKPGYWFAVCLAVYLVIQLAGLQAYPAHFSCDEAVSMVNASALLRNGLRGDHGELLPTFTKNDSQYSLSATVYFAILPYLLFGKSVLAVRLITAFVALLGALWFTLFIRDFVRLREWWLSPLLLSLAPAWFFLARTGLETAQMTAFYIGFWYYYACYRFRRPTFLFPALILGGLVFYTYTPGQIIIVVSGLILLAVDWRYHWQQRSIAWKGALVLILLALPLMRFIHLEPGEYGRRLNMYNSYWIWPDLTLLQKTGIFLLQYLGGLNPVFWFSPHIEGEHIRYAMGNRPPLPWLYAPLILLGLYTLVRGWRAHPELRLAIYALLAAPVGAAVVAGGTLPRLLAVAFPLLLFAALGLSAALAWLEKRRPALQKWSALTLLLFLSATGIFTMLDAYKNGSRWLTDYGLSGLQWGAPQLYGAAREHILKHPQDVILISPNWTFQGQTLRNFFTDDHPQIRVQAVTDFLGAYQEDISQFVFVLTPEDFWQVQQSGKLKPPEVIQITPYPDGRDGFYWARLSYVEDITSILENERTERRKLVKETLLLDGEEVTVQYSTLDMGNIANVFDGDPDSLIRSAVANPLVVSVEFKEARPMRSVTALAGAEPVTLTVEVTDSEGIHWTFKAQGALVADFKKVTVNFGAALDVKSLNILLYDDYVPEPANVHLWEIQFN